MLSLVTATETRSGVHGPMRFDLVFILIFLASQASFANTQSMNGFNLKGALIPVNQIKSGGPPKDGIPSIDNPKFFNKKAAHKALPKDSKAIVIEAKGIRKAYPIPILNWHEIVNDKIGNIPVVITYCPLCGTGVVFKRKVGKNALEFGVSGLLYQSDVLLYDRKTQSLWQATRKKWINLLTQIQDLKVDSIHISILKTSVLKS